MSLRRSTRVAALPIPISTTLNGPEEGKKRATSPVSTSQPVKKARKAVSGTADEAFKKPSGPVTPVRKRQPAHQNVPVLTPTPSLVNTMRAPYSSGDVDDATPPPVDRPVDPHITNATLVTPGGTQNTAYQSQSQSIFSDTSPTRNGLPFPMATTGTILEKACAHLIQVDPRLEPVIKQFRCPVFSPEGLAEEIDPFRSLASSIMGQQVSGAAAKSIKNKFVALFNENRPDDPVFPTPAQVAVTDIARLRLAGLSQRKAEYIQGLAQKFVSGELTNQMLMKASDEEVMEKLIAVRGLGKWSVEMFASFALKRLDILSTGDLGVQRGMAHFFGKDVQKLKAKGGGKWKYMSEQDMLDKSAPFAPYRSLFMWYMWRITDVDISFM